MAHNNLTVALLALAGCLCWTLVLASPDEERYVEKEYNRDLYDWINNVARYGRVQVPATLCKYPNYLPNSLPTNMRMPKRNSELINSLLSLPKNMNEAGK
ncbi:protein PDF [Drosophila hydei]|uniref:Protein PDF n=1 Tax=Drosophila hydei TaxID=7224 RepID=A0A6J1LJQ8_DROHY|nr:protein PDF [Drosophila hydei]